MTQPPDRAANDNCRNQVDYSSYLERSKSTGQMRGYFPKPDPNDTVQDVSLIEVIAHPEKFDGRRLRFIGFLAILFEGEAIYLHRQDFDCGISRNAVWIELPTDMTPQQRGEISMRYVICVGVFRAAFHGHMDMFSGAVTNVERLEGVRTSNHDRSKGSKRWLGRTDPND